MRSSWKWGSGRMKPPKLSQRNRHARRQSGYLRRLYRLLRKEKKQNTREKGKDIFNWIQSFREYQGETKKAVLNEQCKKMEKNNRLGKRKTTDLFKKTGDIRGIFHARMGMIKDRNCRDLPEAEEIKKRWQEYYTKELYRKGLSDADNHNGVITHLK